MEHSQHQRKFIGSIKIFSYMLEYLNKLIIVVNDRNNFLFAHPKITAHRWKIDLWGRFTEKWSFGTIYIRCSDRYFDRSCRPVLNSQIRPQRPNKPRLLGRKSYNGLLKYSAVRRLRKKKLCLYFNRYTNTRVWELISSVVSTNFSTYRAIWSLNQNNNRVR